MCGIAGVFGDQDEATVQAMLASLVHRGPDDGHVVSGEDFAIGARRLSIIDLASGHQPMTDERQRNEQSQVGISRHTVLGLS